MELHLQLSMDYTDTERVTYQQLLHDAVVAKLRHGGEVSSLALPVPQYRPFVFHSALAAFLPLMCVC